MGRAPQPDPKLADVFGCCLFFSAGALFRRVDRLATEAFRPLGVAPSHAFLLMALAESPDRRATASRLADLMTLDRSTVTRLIQRLEARRLVRRRRDGRSTWIRLEAAGVRLLPEIHEGWSRLRVLYGRELGVAEADALNERIARTMRGGKR